MRGERLFQAHDNQLGGDHRHLDNPLEDYALVVVDEAHSYRNPSAPTRAGTLRQLLAGKRRDLVLLTATPVNNSLWDRYHELPVAMSNNMAQRGFRHQMPWRVVSPLVFLEPHRCSPNLTSQRGGEFAGPHALYYRLAVDEHGRRYPRDPQAPGCRQPGPFPVPRS